MNGFLSGCIETVVGAVAKTSTCVRLDRRPKADKICLRKTICAKFHTIEVATVTIFQTLPNFITFSAI